MVLGDFSIQRNSDIGERRLNYAGGLRYSFARTRGQKVVPFAHVLIGASHIKTGADRTWDPMVSLGAGAEYIWGSPAGFGLRGQLDYLVRGGEVSPRATVGVVFRFEKR